MREYRGTLTEPGRNSPYRDRSASRRTSTCSAVCAPASSPTAPHVLRAKIDMGSPNINLRDPALYRIRARAHHTTGDEVVDLSDVRLRASVSDAIEGITHSLCTLEFEDHRPLYDWWSTTDLACPEVAPRRPDRVRAAEPQLHGDEQAQAARSWSSRSSCRAGTTRACRRSRASAAAATRPKRFAISAADRCGKKRERHRRGVARALVREDLNRHAPRALAVLRPLKVVIENYPEGQVEHVEAVNNPEDPDVGTRTIPFSRELYIERDDFMEVHRRRFFRLSPGAGRGVAPTPHPEM